MCRVCWHSLIVPQIFGLDFLGVKASFKNEIKAMKIGKIEAKQTLRKTPCHICTCNSLINPASCSAWEYTQYPYNRLYCNEKSDCSSFLDIINPLSSSYTHILLLWSYMLFGLSHHPIFVHSEDNATAFKKLIWHQFNVNREKLKMLSAKDSFMSNKAVLVSAQVSHLSN